MSPRASYFQDQTQGQKWHAMPSLDVELELRSRHIVNASFAAKFKLEVVPTTTAAAANRLSCTFDKQLAAFQATGCPARSIAAESKMDFAEMKRLCDLTKAGTGSDADRATCCGNRVRCAIPACQLQTAFAHVRESNDAGTSYQQHARFGLNTGMYFKASPLNWNAAFGTLPPARSANSKFTFAFYGCCRGTRADTHSLKGEKTRPECEAGCSTDLACNAFEVNGCAERPQLCKGMCYHFYGTDPEGTLVRGACGSSTYGDRECHAREVETITYEAVHTRPKANGQQNGKPSQMWTGTVAAWASSDGYVYGRRENLNHDQTGAVVFQQGDMLRPTGGKVHMVQIASCSASSEMTQTMSFNSQGCDKAYDGRVSHSSHWWVHQPTTIDALPWIQLEFGSVQRVHAMLFANAFAGCKDVRLSFSYESSGSTPKDAYNYNTLDPAYRTAPTLGITLNNDGRLNRYPFTNSEGSNFHMKTLFVRIAVLSMWGSGPNGAKEIRFEAKPNTDGEYARDEVLPSEPAFGDAYLGGYKQRFGLGVSTYPQKHFSLADCKEACEASEACRYFAHKKETYQTCEFWGADAQCDKGANQVASTVHTLYAKTSEPDTTGFTSVRQDRFTGDCTPHSTPPLTDKQPLWVGETHGNMAVVTPDMAVEQFTIPKISDQFERYHGTKNPRIGEIHPTQGLVGVLLPGLGSAQTVAGAGVPITHYGSGHTEPQVWIGDTAPEECPHASFWNTAVLACDRIKVHILEGAISVILERMTKVPGATFKAVPPPLGETVLEQTAFGPAAATFFSKVPTKPAQPLPGVAATASYSVVQEECEEWKQFFAYQPATFPSTKAMVVLQHIQHPAIRMVGFYDREGGIAWETGVFGPTGAGWTLAGLLPGHLVVWHKGVPAPYSLGAPGSLSCPPSTRAVTKEECEEANLILLPPGMSLHVRFLSCAPRPALAIEHAEASPSCLGRFAQGKHGVARHCCRSHVNAVMQHQPIAVQCGDRPSYNGRNGYGVVEQFPSRVPQAQ